MKWSVVIPTLWESDYIIKQLQTYILSNKIEDIVLIDNSRKYYEKIPNIHQKITLIQPKENIYVNPAWNIGVELAQTDNIIIANDDVLWNLDILNYFTENNLKSFGIIGQSIKNYVDGELTNVPNNNITVEFGVDEIVSWGSLMFIHKSNWKPIPEILKIWYGDYWLVNKAGIPSSTMYNVEIGGAQHATNLSSFSSIVNNDYRNYFNLEN